MTSNLVTDESVHHTKRAHRAKTTRPKSYKKLTTLFVDLAELLRPPQRISITKAAEQYVKLNNPGSYIGPFRSDIAPYMQEPTDVLASRTHTGCIFVGPAQSGKTEALILNWAAYSIKVDPMDMIVYSPTQSAARDFSVRRVDRLHRNSPEVGKVLMTNRDSDNKFDKSYKTGMLLNLSWPSVTEFAGRPIGRVALTDYDRMDDNIEGDGNPYDLGSKRTTSFQSFGMTLAESSPSRELTDHKWLKTTPHEAPPCTGILSLYNRGDRRRWQWPCPVCDEYFEGEWEHLEWDVKQSFADTAATVRMRCPHKGCKIFPGERNSMNRWGVWLRESQTIHDDGHLMSNGLRSPIASFWLKGVAAAFVTWGGLLVSYLNAMADYDRTGSEDSLRKFFNTDLGVPYIPKAAELQRLPETMKARAEPLPYLTIDFESDERIHRATAPKIGAIQPQVPVDVRFLIATVDIQTNMFVVQVQGVRPGSPYDVVLIDRFSIRKSRRVDLNGESLWVKPSVNLEDWEEVTSEVIERTYPLADDSGRRMGVKMTFSDSAGKAGATTNAYNFYRSLKLNGKAARYQLVKGDPLPTRPRTQITYPDANKRDKLSAARGDVPVMLLNSNLLKDALVGRFEVNIRGKGMFIYPNWLPDFWYAECCAEVRTDKGWVATNYRRNESFDLCYYMLAACVSVLIRAESIDWTKPPGWAAEWDKNDLVFLPTPTKTEAFANARNDVYDFAELGNALA